MGRVKVKNIPEKNPTFEECIQYIKNLYKIEGDDLTIGLEIKGHAVYIGRIFTDLRKNGMKFVVKKGTKMSEIGEFLGFDFNEKVEDTTDSSKQVKVIVGQELYYKTETLLDDLKRVISTMVPEDFKASHGKNIGLIRQEELSILLGQAKGHISKKYTLSKDLDYFIPIEVLGEYLSNLRQSEYIRNINDKVLPLINKYIKYNDCPLTSKGIYKGNPNFKAIFFKYINTIEKAYWLGLIFAEANLHLTPDGQVKFQLACNVDDGVLLKRFIEAIGLNPSKVKYYKSYYVYEEDGSKKTVGKEDANKDGVFISQMFRIQFKNKEFANTLKSLGLPTGKSSDKIRFPQLRNGELQLAFLLGFFDGDGHLKLEESGGAKTAILSSSSKEFLEDIKLLFDLDYEIISETKRKLKDGSIKEYFKIQLKGEVYNEMMALQLRSLDRKRSIFTEEVIKNQRIYRKMMFSEEELINFVSMGYTDSEIAERHKQIHNIEISREGINAYTRVIRRASTNLLRDNI